MELIKGKDTTLIFHILDLMKGKRNLLSQIKIKEKNMELASFDLIKEKYIYNLKKEYEQKNLILNIELLNEQVKILFEIDIILYQTNYFYLLINEINENIFDFMYKNYTKEKKTLKHLIIIYGKEKIEYKLDFNFIDKNEKISRIILLNFSHKFKINLDINYWLNKSSINKWLYCLKQYNNDLLLSCHLKSLYPEKIDKKEKEEANNFITYYKNLLNGLINEKGNQILIFIRIGEAIENNKDIIKLYQKYLTIPIDMVENYSEKDLLYLYNFLYVKMIVLIHSRHNEVLLEEEAKNKLKDRNQKLKIIIKKFFDEIENSLNNLNYSYEKIKHNNLINYVDYGKKLAIITSLLIEYPLGKYNIDTLREINLDELSKKNQNNYYVKSVKIFMDIIIHLTSESLLSECGVELNSKYTKNYNISIKDKFSQEINIITIEELKNHLLSLVPNKFYAAYHDSNNYSYFEPISKNIIMNEKSIFQYMEEKKIKIIFERKDENGNYTLTVLTLIFHESFGHAKIRIEDPNSFSPLKFNYKGFLISLMDNNNNYYQESGRIIEKFLTNFNIENQLFLLNSSDKDVNRLLDYNLYVDDLQKLNKIICEISDSKKDSKITNFSDYLKEYEENKNKINNQVDSDELLNNLKKYLPSSSDTAEELLKNEPKKNYIESYLWGRKVKK